MSRIVEKCYLAMLKSLIRVFRKILDPDSEAVNFHC